MAELHQADAVFQGGGVKGIALVGALIEFGDHGWTEWISVAGTSAGSIIASYIACGHGPDDLEKLLRETPYEKFQDWGAGGKVIGGGLNLIRHHGLAHGEYFHKWFLEQTEEKTFGDVKKSGKTLKLIASDVANKKPSRPPRRPGQLPAAGRDRPDRPRLLSDRRRSPDEHVDPVTSSSLSSW